MDEPSQLTNMMLALYNNIVTYGCKMLIYLLFMMTLNNNGVCFIIMYFIRRCGVYRYTCSKGCSCF